MASEGYKRQELTGFGIFRPKINGMLDTQTPFNGAPLVALQPYSVRKPVSVRTKKFVRGKQRTGTDAHMMAP